ncbi:MAG: GDSL-type esterase/lipase family protein [Cyanobacteria bacterium P01_E01_bin.42]
MSAPWNKPSHRIPKKRRRDRIEKTPWQRDRDVPIANYCSRSSAKKPSKPAREDVPQIALRERMLGEREARAIAIREDNSSTRSHSQRFEDSINSYNWSVLSLATNGILLLIIAYLWQQQPKTADVALANLSGASMQLLARTPLARERNSQSQRLNYQQWVELLAREANSAAERQDDNLAVLLGDSITLWFSQNFLPDNKIWLNQGISGEKTKGLLRRLHLLDRANPDMLFVMIGINDVLAGIGDETILANYRLILQDLRTTHPQTRIIVQSILPHSGEKATWEGRDRLLEIPNARVRDLNRRLQAIAYEENAFFLDLYPLFADERGNLRMELSTDGLHLNAEGYQVWSTALKIFDRVSESGK